MKKILVITDKYYPRPYANALCAQELIRAFQKRGFEIDIIAFQDSGIEMPRVYEGSDIYPVQPDWRLKLFYYAENFPQKALAKICKLGAHFFSKSKAIFLLPWTPLYSFSFPRRIYHLMERLQTENHYDVVISILNPFEGTYAAMKFKQKHQDIPFIIYAVDTIEKSRFHSGITGKIADPFFWEKRFLDACDAFFYMQSRSERYAQVRFQAWRDKLIVTDLPRFTLQDYEILPYSFGKSGEHWVYAGSLGGVHYPVEDAIKFFLSLPQDRQRTLHFFGRGQGLKTAQRAQKEAQERIIAHGYVDSKTLQSILCSCDVLVSIKYSDQISAKIFEYISYRKPIVHFSGHPEDPDVIYYQKYPLAFVVQTYKADFEQSDERLMDFLERIKGTTVSQEELLRIYETNTPEYSINRILEVIVNE